MATDRRSEDEGLYRRLNVPPGASPAQISRAYRRLAQASHPDTHPADAGAPRRFLAITEAYEILSDPQRRACYDRDQLKPPSPRPSPAVRPEPPRPASPPPTITVIEPTGRRGPAVLGGPPNPAEPALAVGPLHWQPQPGSSLRPGPTAELYTLLDALRQLGWW